jgi:hypothetical protein
MGGKFLLLKAGLPLPQQKEAAALARLAAGVHKPVLSTGK